MKAKKILGLFCLVTLALPLLASAEIYKWKDKNGVTRYSDSPPQADIKIDTLKGKSINRPAPQNVGEEKSNTGSYEKAVSDSVENDRENDDREAAKMRARNAESEKRNRLEKEKNAKLNKENCKAAKANYATFKQGGRIYKTKANGEREYYGDDEMKTQKNKAQAEIRKFCR